jgi:hypothetical protein
MHELYARVGWGWDARLPRHWRSPTCKTHEQTTGLRARSAARPGPASLHPTKDAPPRLAGERPARRDGGRGGRHWPQPRPHLAALAEVVAKVGVHLPVLDGTPPPRALPQPRGRASVGVVWPARRARQTWLSVRWYMSLATSDQCPRGCRHTASANRSSSCTNAQHGCPWTDLSARAHTDKHVHRDGTHREGPCGAL